MSATPVQWRAFCKEGQYRRYPDAGLSTNIYPADSDAYEQRIASGVHVANAPLIAAAPSLLQVAKDTLTYWIETGFAECDEGCDCLVDEMRAAIARAEGRS